MDLETPRFMWRHIQMLHEIICDCHESLTPGTREHFLLEAAIETKLKPDIPKLKCAKIAVRNDFGYVERTESQRPAAKVIKRPTAAKVMKRPVMKQQRPLRTK